MLKQVVLLWNIRLVYSFMQNPRYNNRNNVVKIDIVAISVSLYIKHSEALKFFQVLKIVGKLCSCSIYKHLITGQLHDPIWECAFKIL